MGILAVGLASTFVQGRAQSSHQLGFSRAEAENWIHRVLDPAALHKQWSQLQELQTTSHAWERARYLSWGSGAPNPHLPKWRVEKDDCAPRPCRSNSLRLSLVWLNGQRLEERLVGSVSMQVLGVNHSQRPAWFAELHQVAKRSFQDWANQNRMWNDEDFHLVSVPQALRPLQQRWLREPQRIDLRWELALILRQQAVPKSWLVRAKHICKTAPVTHRRSELLNSAPLKHPCDGFVKAVVLEIPPPT